MSSEYIKKIRTEDGDKQIDYESLANLPDLSKYAKQSDLSELQATVNDLKGNQTTASGWTNSQIELLKEALYCMEFSNEELATTGKQKIDALIEALKGSSNEEENPDSGEAEITLSSISATYNGGNVTVGTALTDLIGIVVTAHYSDGSTANVTGYTLNGNIAEGSNIITVSYGGKTTTFTVTGIVEETGIPYALKNGTHTFSNGATVTITNGNHVKVEGITGASHINLSDVTANGETITDSANINNAEIFKLLTGQKVKYTVSNFTGENTAYGKNGHLAKANSTDYLALHSFGNVGWGNREVEYTMTEDVSIGCIPLYISSVTTSPVSMEFDLSITVDGVQYV